MVDFDCTRVTTYMCIYTCMCVYVYVFIYCIVSVLMHTCSLRYTANDPCRAQCQFLYKDHYHCNHVDCGWLFRSKDGVREHAK